MSDTPHPSNGHHLPSESISTRIDTTEPADCPVAVVAAVAAAAGRDIDELPPLSESIDPDVVEALFRDDPVSQVRERTLSFHYAEHDVVVDSDGVVRVAHHPTPDQGG